MARDWKETPYIGMPATISYGSDSYPYVVFDVANKTNTFELGDPKSLEYDRVSRQYVYKKFATVTWPVWIDIVTVDHRYNRETKSHEYEDIDISKPRERFILKDGVYRAAAKKYDYVTGKYIQTNRASKYNKTVQLGTMEFHHDPSF